MKNVLKTFVATAVAAVMIYNADAQSAAVNLSQNNAPGSAIFTPGEQKDKNALSDIHPRAVKDFQRSFKSITDEQWSRLNDGYIASFTEDSVQTRVGYNRKGNRQYTLRYYDEKKLPGEVWNIVKSTYYAYTILTIAEVDLNDQPVYIIYMQDKTHLKTIGVYDGEIKEVNNYTRG